MKILFKMKESLKPSEKRVNLENVCPALGNDFMIDSNGDITTCCLDERLMNKLGNLKDGFKTVIDSKILKKWIKAQEEKDFENMAPLCKKCNFYQELFL